MKGLRLRPTAYTLDAIIDAGIDPDVAWTLMADGPSAVPERPLLRVAGRRRELEPTTRYVWGPDAMTLLAEREEQPAAGERAA